MAGKKRRGVSAGTVIMLAVTLTVCIGLTAVLQRLSDGTSVTIDAGRVLSAITLSDQLPELSLSDIPITITHSATRTPPQPTRNAPEVEAWVVTGGQSTRAPAAPTASPAPTPTQIPRGGTFSLTAGGSVCVETNVRQSGYYKDAKAYDFTEVLSLIRRDLDSDVNLVTLENLVAPDAKLSDTVAPAEVMRMLTLGGVDTVALGWSKAFDKKFDGLASTVKAAQDEKLRVIGAYAGESEAAIANRLVTVGNVKVGLLHYTDNLPSAAAKALTKDGRTWALPVSDQVAGDIARVRDAGAEVVIVSINWGTVAKTAPTKAQKALAQAIADAGADVLLGAGSRVVQPAEWLTGTRLDGAEYPMLCLYSLGTLISDNRKDGQVAGMLLKLTVTVDADGHVSFPRTDYIPTYVWRFKQDNMYSYRVVPADRPAPDGMESAQQKSMTNAYNNIVKVLGDSPLTLRSAD